MGEAAALPSEDPVRQELEAEISRQGLWAEKEWLDLLSQDEHCRLALRKVPVPPDLEAKLLAIPEQGRVKRITAVRKVKLMATIGTCALALLLAAFFLSRSAWRQDSSLQTMALMAINEHLNDRHVDIKPKEGVLFESQFSGHTSFRVRIPDLGPELQLLGGRHCTLGIHPVAYSLWTSKQGEYSLFQFKLADVEVSPISSPRQISPKTPVLAGSPCEVLFWSEGDSGFILVADRGEFLKDIPIDL